MSNVTNTSVFLSWSPPVNGGGRPLSEIFYTIRVFGGCYGCLCLTLNVCIVIKLHTTGQNESYSVENTETNVCGLTPGVYYTFSVTAENAVSSQDTNITARTANLSARTEEGGNNNEFERVKNSNSLVTNPATIIHPTC